MKIKNKSGLLPLLFCVFSILDYKGNDKIYIETILECDSLIKSKALQKTFCEFKQKH